MESLEASFGSYLCQFKQFEDICITVKKQVYLNIEYALSETIWSMPFSCLPVIWKESNLCCILQAFEHKDSISAMPFSSPSERKKQKQRKPQSKTVIRGFQLRRENEGQLGRGKELLRLLW